MAPCLCLNSARVRTAAPRCEARKAVPRSSAATRRALLSTMVGTGLVALNAPRSLAVLDIQIADDRKHQNFLISQDDMRDDKAPFKARNFFQGEVALLSDKEHKDRLGKAKDRLSAVPSFIDAEKWSAASQEIGQSLGTARYDLDSLTAKLGDRASRKRALELQNVAMRNFERLDYYLRKKDKSQAKAYYDKAKDTFSQAIGAIA